MLAGRPFLRESRPIVAQAQRKAMVEMVIGRNGMGVGLGKVGCHRQRVASSF